MQSPSPNKRIDWDITRRDVILYGGAILLAFGIEQFIGYQLFKIPIKISWWISFISVLFGLCLILRSINLYKKSNK